METTQDHYYKTIATTRDNLRTIAQSKMVRDLSQLALPEVDEMVDRIAQMVPAGNLPGMILSGLSRLQGRKAPPKVVRRDVNMLFKGVEVQLDKAVYTTFFAGPAAVIWGYQNILKLAGKSVEDAFPQGLWQFYAEYALREDTARHANETHGFDTYLSHNGIRLRRPDRITAWVLAAIHALHNYNALLENEWRERVYLTLLNEVLVEHPDAASFENLYHQWEQQRPYRRSGERARKTYTDSRKEAFDQFRREHTRGLSLDILQTWADKIDEASAHFLTGLDAYQAQMSLLAYLEPDKYGEERVPIPIQEAQIGLIYDGRYYLIPACEPNSEKPPHAETVRAQVEAILTEKVAGIPPAYLKEIASVRRSAFYNLRNNLNPRLQEGLNALRLAPILLNADYRPGQLHLAEIRQAERGVGDHALTIFDTGKSFVFDQSHIFFDGAWGAAFAEIITNEALSWGRYLHENAASKPKSIPPTRVLNLPLEASEQEFIRSAPHVTIEASAENQDVNLVAIRSLRRIFKSRNDLLGLTVNDLLVLYRAIHMLTYEPDPALVAHLKEMTRKGVKGAGAALEAIEQSREVSPTILIPVDASQQTPRDRVFPLSYEVPLNELDFIGTHERVMDALRAYSEAEGDRRPLYDEYIRLRDKYMGLLAAFGQVLSQAKKQAAQGESISTATMKLMAHIPIPLQRFLDKIPGRFDVLNDMIKGREVFSNVGAVVPTSTLSRFITAKDDNEKKTLAWGVITTAEGMMHISLRDFRPHVALLVAAGHEDVANRIAQDYLNAYVRGLNRFVRDLRTLLLARPTLHPDKRRTSDFLAVDPLVGVKLGDYKVEAVIGYGTTAHVYRASDTVNFESVAIKIVDAGTPERARALAESLQPLIKWKHKHIEALHGVVLEGELCYLITQYIPGTSLAARLAEDAERGTLMPQTEVLSIGQAIAGALDYAHKRKVIHHNFKPANVLLSNRGGIFVTDFGRAFEEHRRPIGERYPHPYYVAPEQVRSLNHIVPQTDVYAFGVMLYQMLTGVVPLDNPSIDGLAFMHKSHPIPPPRSINPELNAATAEVLVRALNKQAEKRYQSAGELMEALESALAMTPPSAKTGLELPPLPAEAPRRRTTTNIPTTPAPQVEEKPKRGRGKKATNP